MSLMVTFPAPPLLSFLSKCLFSVCHPELYLGHIQSSVEYIPSAFWELKLSHLPPCLLQTFVRQKRNVRRVL